MKAVSALCLILLITPLAAFATDAKRPSSAVATIGNVAITTEELDRVVGNRLMRVRTDEYSIRRAALDELISQKLLADEAKRRGITVEALLQAEVDAKVMAPSVAVVEPFYEATKERYGNVPPEQAMKDIIESMRRQRSAARLAELHRGLREKANVRVALEPPRVSVPANGPSRGNAAAPVTIVEYSDFECPFCGRAAATVRKIGDEYPDQVRIVHRDFPLPSHNGAPRAAEAAYCAGDQGKYWEMNERLFSKGGPIAESDLRRFAADVQLDARAFDDCLKSGKHGATWKSAQAEGSALGVQSTPTFFINGRMIAGAAPYEAFTRIINEELERLGVRRNSQTAPAVAANASR